jgi:hypothetical protein
MDLPTHQRKLLGLFRSNYEVRPEDDAYIQRIARSKDLGEARGNIFLWRVWVLERTAPLTFNLIKRRHLLQETVCAFIKEHNISPFRETQAPAFLGALSGHHDSLIASVAQFELALLKVKQGDPGFYVVRWEVEPHTILNSLAKDLPLEDKVPEGAYEVHISRELPSLFQIVRVHGEGRPSLRGIEMDTEERMRKYPECRQDWPS